MAKKRITTDALAAMIERNIAHKEDIESLRRDLNAGVRELRQGQENILQAVRGIEVRRQDFDALKDDVADIGRRLKAVEKRR